MKKHFLKKLILDPLPILDFFVPSEDTDLIDALLGPEGLRYCLDHHTVNSGYADCLAEKYHLAYQGTHLPINSQETQAILARSLSSEVEDFLALRRFPLDLCEKYGVTSWKLERHDWASWIQWFPFNPKALVQGSRALAQMGLEVWLPGEHLMVCPSYDRQGELNNLVMRYTHPIVSEIGAKWLFSHGRQATFGLHLIDPLRPVFLVEGFYDYVAMNELGYNAVGLGSAFISPRHWEFLEGLEVVFLLDSDETGRKYSHRMTQEGHKVAWLKDNYKDPYEWWIHEGRVEFVGL